ncbi:MAG TPA: isoprenylcysteine carboxylmethyltransferase family protein [Candidatus Acidoferrum sp.]|nr:isoprenylcysteine carboxylmethyltransferase family protein [Candidatus Acidoferrum sp.]
MNNPLRFLLRVPVPWVFVLSYLLGAALESVRPSPRFPTAAQAITIVGGVLFVLGAIIAGWGLLIFRKVRTTTVPGQTSTNLVTWGPYRFTRNPMYVGLVLAYLGEAALLKQIWPLVVLPFTLLYLNTTVIPLEEAKLQEVFPEEYEQFRSRVRRWL